MQLFLRIPVPFLQELNHSGLIPVDSAGFQSHSGGIQSHSGGIQRNLVIPAGIYGASKSTDKKSGYYYNTL
jgi:hypothetical protein